ncbi:hypothetical protein CONPUDRAFT_82756 [Coniophora puteana RWD-64-598 SS2]|uniref:Uncharacterized protein n=1 Tax=Coniophora puteana (strain RWD-64-598) TaxID=741705 RepID=A0A5M3MNG1_CONPW|nr:uncharacterized protein CONPUDRAFT_82756 [Coniophora puteana RWD-64-598 SS2]EIW80587.1 hypothetical protein CONPUDRAFT_82756 [Coniophora puteana RWD-64-598 SS2]
MAHTSPAVNLVWSILTTLLASFLVFHLWSFDRFKCLKWNNGPYSGAFKRIMTYSYIATLPLLMVYALGFTIIKYKYGYTYLPGYGVIPTPFELWSDSSKNAIIPLYLCFSIGWGLEMVTHLEELCFWLFLLNAGSVGQDWFRSLYFRTWAVGSVVAVLYMPLVTIFTRGDYLKCEAYTFLAGSIGSFALTVWFLPILWAFPAFLDSLRRESVDTNTVVRLTKFHELNCIRVFFRFLFTVPFIILGIDGVRPHQHINDNMFATDFLAMIAGVGCSVSSALTLVIFFPRSIESEIANKDRRRGTSTQDMIQTQQTATRQGGGGGGPGRSFALHSLGAGDALSPDADGEEEDDRDDLSEPYERAPSAAFRNNPTPPALVRSPFSNPAVSAGTGTVAGAGATRQGSGGAFPAARRDSGLPPYSDSALHASSPAGVAHPQQQQQPQQQPSSITWNNGKQGLEYVDEEEDAESTSKRPLPNVPAAVAKEEEASAGGARLVPNRRTTRGDVEMGRVLLTRENLAWHNAAQRNSMSGGRGGGVNRLVHGFRSPIDLMDTRYP